MALFLFFSDCLFSPLNLGSSSFPLPPLRLLLLLLLLQPCAVVVYIEPSHARTMVSRPLIPASEREKAVFVVVVRLMILGRREGIDFGLVVAPPSSAHYIALLICPPSLTPFRRITVGGNCLCSKSLFSKLFLVNP